MFRLTSTTLIDITKHPTTTNYIRTPTYDPICMHKHTLFPVYTHYVRVKIHTAPVVKSDNLINMGLHAKIAFLSLNKITKTMANIYTAYDCNKEIIKYFDFKHVTD